MWRQKWWQPNRILVAKGVATLHGKNWAGSLAITFWRQQRCQNLMGAFWGRKGCKHLQSQKALGVHGTWWQRRCEKLFGDKWGCKLMAKVLANFGATSTIERDVDKNHASPIAPSAEATPTDPMNKTRNQENMIGWHVVFNYPFAGGAKAASASARLSFQDNLPSLPVKK